MAESKPVGQTKQGGPAVSLVRQEVTYQGPLPPPQILTGYEQALKGGAERIFLMAEKEQAHRHAIESRDLSNKTAVVALGQVLAFLTALTGILTGGFLVFHDKTLTGFGFFFTSLAVLAGVYFFNRKAAANTNAPTPK